MPRFEDHPTVPVTSVHSLVAIAGRVVAINRNACVGDQLDGRSQSPGARTWTMQPE